MYRFILILILAVSVSLKAQIQQPTFLDNITVSQEQIKLTNTVRSNTELNSLKADLFDFLSKAQKGLNFMSPGSTITDLKCERITEFSTASSDALRSFLMELHKKDIDKMDLNSLELVISDFQNKNCMLGIMSWRISDNSNSKLISSVAVFDNEWNVLFDTELVKFISGQSELEYHENETEIDGNNPNSSTVITNQKSGSITFSYWVEGTFGDVRHYNKVSATAIVPPYITAATNDAFFNSNTTEIISERRDAEFLSPPTDPCVYFGTGGTIANSYSSAVPFSSRVYLSNTNDHFNDGTYQVSGSNGNNWSFTFDFSVSAGGVGLGITPHQTTPDFTMSSPNFSEVNVRNHVYYYLLGNTYRALFYDGGALRMSNFNILTGNGSGEVGNVNVRLPLQVAYWSYLILYPYSFTGVTLSLSNIEYLRGDHVRQPVYTLSSSNYNIPLGQTDTLKAKITNSSNEVKINGGNISLNVSSLGDKLTLLSAATLPVGEININTTKTFNFIVRGNSNGVVTPQINISAAGWTWPVPPDVVINDIFSIDSNISVGSVGISNISSEIPDEFSISQNYPNPFNPVTNINFSIPEKSFVKVSVYDMLGKRIQNLINEDLNAGYYKVDFNGNNLPSGVYFYRIEANNFVQIKKMTLLK